MFVLRQFDIFFPLTYNIIMFWFFNLGSFCQDAVFNIEKKRFHNGDSGTVRDSGEYAQPQIPDLQTASPNIMILKLHLFVNTACFGCIILFTSVQTFRITLDDYVSQMSLLFSHSHFLLYSHLYSTCGKVLIGNTCFCKTEFVALSSQVLSF